MGAAPAGGVVGAVAGSWRGGRELGRWRGAAWGLMGSRFGSNGSYNYFAAHGAIAPWLMAPSSCPSLSSARSSASSFWLLASTSVLATSKPAAQNTQPQQAPTQAPSTKQNNSKPVAAQRQAAWLGLAASGFWLLASWPLASASPVAKISGPAAQSMAMAMGDHPSSL